MRTPKHPFRLLIILAVAACSSTGRGDGVRRDPNLITQQELTQILDASVYQSIERLRPRWLRTRGTGSASVIMDGQPIRGLDILRSVRPGEVETLRFLSALDASFRYGIGYPNGAIEVVTRRR